MDSFNEQNILINFNLFKQLQFYQIFYSYGSKIFGLNIHQVFYIVFGLVGLCIQCYGLSTSFFNNCKNISKIDYFLMVYASSQMYQSYWKIFKCLNDRNRLLDLFKIAQLNFLTSEECDKYNKILYKHHDKNLKFANYFLIISFVVILQWFIFPIVLNEILNFENSNVRAQNIINFCFGVSTQTYNKYIHIFYLLETTGGSLTVYFLTMVDTLIISLCSAIIYQQNVLIYAFKNIGYENKPKINYYSTFKSILQDQLRLNLKIKLFYSIMKSTMLLNIAIDSFSSMIFTYLFILREMVNYSIYSCNWMKMDLKFKRLLLLTMQMNNANRMMIKASPKKIINLQLFASIMSMSFNMVPVLLKITNTENHKSQ